LNNIYIPSAGAEQWTQFLAEPVKHWRTGFSARTLAYYWESAIGFPFEVGAALATEPKFDDIKLLLAIPEHQVHLPGGSRPSQNDIWVLARAGKELVSIAVEGKVAEPFGPTVQDWLADGSPGKTARLAFLCNALALNEQALGPIRYQLLHRAASAVIEARRFCASHAVMLVHSFSESQQWFDDYESFAALFGSQVGTDSVACVGRPDGIHLYLCWVCGDRKFLMK
jgi:hypothetical protein